MPTVEGQVNAALQSHLMVGSVTAQKRYTRAASLRLHHWSYNQLAEQIKCKAAKLGIPVCDDFSATVHALVSL